MATVKKQGRGYKITVSNGHDINGKHIRHHTTWVPDPGMTKKQIEKELNRQMVLFEELVKTGGLRVSGNVRLVEFTERFMRDHIKVNRKPNTAARYERDLRRINKAMGHLKLSQITPAHINAFAAALQGPDVKDGGGKLAPSSVNTILRTLSAALGYAVKWGYIQNNPAINAEGPGQEYSEVSYLDEADARIFLRELKTQPIKWRALVTCDFLSGFRRGELLGLQWPDIDFDRELVYIRRTWNYTGESGCYFGTPKSARSRRPVHLSPAFFAVLKEYKCWQDQQRIQLGDAWKGSPKDPRVFTTDDGRPVFPTSPTWWISKFSRKIGVQQISTHSLRHTYASLMISDEVPIVEVSKQLGHARASTTTDYYGHVIAAAHAKGIRTMSKFDDFIVPTLPTDHQSKD